MEVEKGSSSFWDILNKRVLWGIKVEKTVGYQSGEDSLEER